MGINYYLIRDHCPVCSRYDKVHIGKKSAGWVFHFQGYPEKGIVSWKDWKKVLKGKIIVDEHGYRVSYETFRRMVEETLDEPKNYVTYMNETRRAHCDKYWVDKEGYPFSDMEFS